MALSRGVLLLGVLLLAVALLPQQAQAGVWDDIRTSFQDAWAKTKGVFQGATAYVECKAVDVTFSMEPCWQAPDSDLCTDACKAELDKLPAKCMDRLAGAVAAQNNPAVTERLEAQLQACGFTVTPTNSARAGRWAGALVPLALLAGSLALLEMLHP